MGFVETNLPRRFQPARRAVIGPHGLIPGETFPMPELGIDRVQCLEPQPAWTSGVILAALCGITGLSPEDVSHELKEAKYVFPQSDVELLIRRGHRGIGLSLTHTNLVFVEAGDEVGIEAIRLEDHWRWQRRLHKLDEILEDYPDQLLLIPDFKERLELIAH